MMRRFMACLLILWTFACGRQNSATQLKDGVEPEAMAMKSYITLLYWDNKNLGFGHVATEVYAGESDKPTYYVSYAMGNNYAVDLAKHGKQPVRVVMPLRSDEQFQKFETWFLDSLYANVHDERYASQYSMLRRNCAHAALDVLRAFDYDLPIQGEAPFALRPWQVFKAAKQYIEQH